ARAVALARRRGPGPGRGVRLAKRLEPVLIGADEVPLLLIRRRGNGGSAGASGGKERDGEEELSHGPLFILHEWGTRDDRSSLRCYGIHAESRYCGTALPASRNDVRKAGRQRARRAPCSTVHDLV